MARATIATAKPGPPVPASATPGNFPVIKDRKVIDAAEEHVKLKSEADRIERRLDDLKTVLLLAMGDAPTAYAGARILVANTVPALPDIANVTITRDMVGQVIPGKRGRRGYTQLRVQ